MKKTKVLLIDDEVDIADLVKTRLEYGRYHIVPCYTSARGLEVAKREKPELILMDIVMPDLDGYELCRIIKNDDETKKIPVILFTAKDSAADRIEEKWKEAGADDYMIKPENIEDLIKKIEELLDKRGL